MSQSIEKMFNALPYLMERSDLASEPARALKKEILVSKIADGYMTLLEDPNISTAILNGEDSRTMVIFTESEHTIPYLGIKLQKTEEGPKLFLIGQDHPSGNVNQLMEPFNKEGRAWNVHRDVRGDMPSMWRIRKSSLLERSDIEILFQQNPENIFYLTNRFTMEVVDTAKSLQEKEVKDEELIAKLQRIANGLTRSEPAADQLTVEFVEQQVLEQTETLTQAQETIRKGLQATGQLLLNDTLVYHLHDREASNTVMRDPLLTIWHTLLTGTEKDEEINKLKSILHFLSDHDIDHTLTLAFIRNSSSEDFETVDANLQLELLTKYFVAPTVALENEGSSFDNTVENQ